MGSSIDAIELAQAMIRCNSVTPADGGTLDVLQDHLDTLGFTCHRMTFGGAGTDDVQNLYARLGTLQPNLCFAGHTDVVPVGNGAAWSVDPFAAKIENGKLFGRGASDMKSAIAAFVAACSRHLAAEGAPSGSISMLITGDEEGPAINGTKKVLEWMKARGEIIDACIVGEPTNPDRLGEMIKIGRRGSVTADLTVRGTQGHVAYPHLADNPVTRIVSMLSALASEPLDSGTEHFQPSNLEVTTIDVGNPASNVIPSEAHARFNIRFNDRHTADSLQRWIVEKLDSVGGAYDLAVQVTGEAFLTPPGPLSDIIARAVKDRLGIDPELSTTGGTSDARFIKDVAPVAEFGLIGSTMHKVDEHVAVADVEALSDIYEDVIGRFFTKN
ncbi:MAG: succinyl-diaminopimelate desuccinylase [Alphaproteobacteria bacterium]|nr:succinyl-diaminopimelate desuccinylase [Alphaproteobacteria bacterium]